MAAVAELGSLGQQMTPTPQTRRRRLHLFLVGASIYACLWSLTLVVGSSQIQRETFRSMHIPEASTDISTTAPFDSGYGYFETAAPTPHHWCVTRTYTPFVVVARSGVNSGGLGVRGENVVCLWFFGYTKIVRGTAWIT